MDHNELRFAAFEDRIQQLVFITYILLLLGKPTMT